MKEITKHFAISLFSAFILAKLTSVVAKTNKGEIEDDSLSFIMNPVKDFYHTVYLDKIKPINFIGESSGFDGSIHILNYLLTYTPAFMLLFFLIGKRSVIFDYVSQEVGDLKGDISFKPKDIIISVISYLAEKLANKMCKNIKI